MEKKYGKLFFIIFFLYFSNSFAQEYLGGKKDDIASFFKLEKIKYEEEKIDENYSRFIMNSYDNEGGLREVSVLTFEKETEQTRCIMQAKIYGYSDDFYRELSELRYGQGFKATNYWDRDGFPVTQYALGKEASIQVIYSVVSRHDQDNDGKDDIVSDAFYLNTAQFITK